MSARRNFLGWLPKPLSFPILAAISFLMIVTQPIMVMISQSIKPFEWERVLECTTLECESSAFNERFTQIKTIYLKKTYANCQYIDSWHPLGTRSIRIEGGYQPKFVFPVATGDGKEVSFVIPIEGRTGSCQVEFKILGGKYFELTLNNKVIQLHRYNSAVFSTGEVNVEPTGMASGYVYVPSRNSAEVPYHHVDTLISQAFSFVSILVFFSLLTTKIIKYNSLLNGTLEYSLTRYRKVKAVLMGVFVLYLLSLIIWMINRPQAPNIITWATDTPFMQSGPRFSDFFQIFYLAQFSEPYYYGASNYPPFALFVLKLFHIFPSMFAFQLLFMGSLFVLGIWGYLFVYRSWLGALLPVISFPVLFAVDRGNLDLPCIALVMISLTLAKRNSFYAGVLFGIAAAIKFWPILLLLAFLRKQANFALLSFFFFVAFHFIGLFSFESSLLPDGATRNGNWGVGEIGHNVSMQNFFSLSLTVLRGDFNLQSYNDVRKSWIVIVFVCIAAATFLLVSLFHKRLVLRVYAAAVLLVAIPGISYSYRLAVLLIPVILYSNYYFGLNSRSTSDRLQMASLIFLLGPTAFVYYPQTSISTDVLFANLGMIMLGLSMCSILQDGKQSPNIASV